MIKIENVILPSAEQWRTIILGARNAMNSWGRSDSKFIEESNFNSNDYPCGFKLGPNDLDLMKRLRNAGTDHRKFMRMIAVYADITAPRYWWAQFDTYKVGTVANSCSTMHRIHAKEFTLDDFSCEHMLLTSLHNLNENIEILNMWRKIYINGGVVAMSYDGDVEEFAPKDKRAWWQMIQLLPSSYNQKRTVMMNYEVLANIYRSRKNHKLDEWRDFCDWIITLPYSQLITGDD